jgi:hypothetical protein
MATLPSECLAPDGAYVAFSVDNPREIGSQDVSGDTHTNRPSPMSIVPTALLPGEPLGLLGTMA